MHGGVEKQRKKKNETAFSALGSQGLFHVVSRASHQESAIRTT